MPWTLSDNAHLPPTLRTIFARSDRFVVCVLAVAFIYVLFRLTPSSYALALQFMGAGNTGLVLGAPEPLRSDEWAIWTPYMQIAVNNHFGQINQTSIYHEPLRNFNVLPLWDWALPFKPEVWAFFLLEPSRAFSIYHASIMAGFVCGWYLAFRQLTFSGPFAAFGALLFYFTAGTQGWWTTIGPTIAFFPFVLWAFLAPIHPAIKAPLVAWLTAVWLLSHLYPPIIVTLSFAGAAMVLAFRCDALLKPWSAAATLMGAAVGLSVAYFYLADAIAAMEQTVYPGSRLSMGGGVPMAQWIAQFLPHFSLLNGDTFLPGSNYLEATTAATFLPLLVLCFADWRRLRALAMTRGAERFAIVILGASLALILVWQLTPLPLLGKLLLWERAPASRFVFASGVLLLALAMTLLQAARPTLTPLRFGIAAVLLIAGFAFSKGVFAAGRYADGLSDLIPLAPLAALAAWTALRKDTAQDARAIAAAALAAGIASFGFYNPMQSAWPIFHRPPSPIASILDQEIERNPHHWLALPAPGAVLNGWGYPSVAHVLIRPQTAFFRPFFPDMPEQDFMAVFNRYGHVVLGDVAKPFSPQPDVVQAPLAMFGGAPPALTATLRSTAPRRLLRKGNVDIITVQDGVATISGWTALDTSASGATIMVSGANIAAVDYARGALRLDVAGALRDPRFAYAGFTIQARLKDPAAGLAQLCVWSEDARLGPAQAADAPGASLCPAQ